MGKRIPLVVLILVFLISIDIIYAQSESTNSKSFIEELKPSYLVYGMLNTTSIDPGESIKLSVYIAGYGNIKNSKLILTTYSDIIDTKIPIKAIFFDFNNKCQFTGLLERNQSPFGGGLILTPCFFTPDSSIVVEGCPILPSYFVSPIFSEMMHNGTAPISYIIKTRDRNFFDRNYPSGDNKITLVFIYSDGTEWRSTEQNIELHVNTFPEEHPFPFAAVIALIGGIVISVANLIWHIFELIWNIIQKKIKRN